MYVEKRMNSLNTAVTRRTVAKSTAWAIPAVAVGAAAPALAASGSAAITITPALIDNANWCSGAPQVSTAVTGLQITGLAPGVTVTGVSATFYFQTGVDASGNQAGLPFNVTGPTGTKVTSGSQSVAWAAAAAGCGVGDNNGGPTSGTAAASGWTPSITLNQNAGNQTFNGSSDPTWSATIATSATSVAGTYVTQSNGTVTYTMSGGSGTALLTVTDVDPLQITYYSVTITTVTFSDGTSLSYTSNVIKHP